MQMMNLVPQRFSRALPLLVATILFLFLVTGSRLRRGTHSPPPLVESKPAPEPHRRPPPERPQLAVGECIPEIEFLRRAELGLTDTIKYSRRCVKPITEPSYNRDIVANVSQPLIAHQATVNLTSCAHVDSIPCDLLPIHVPPPYPKKSYNHILFGVASSAKRLNDSLPAFAHWLSGTGARIVGVVVDAANSDVSLAALEQDYRKWEVDATFLAPTFLKRPDSDQPARVEHLHFGLIRDLLAAADQDTNWLGILDDDTFFPSLYPLDQELAKYDHSKSLWLGALSDSFSSVKNWGFMAYGGAGVFLSTPLAKELEPRLEQCINETTINTGDGLLRDCIYAHTHTKLTLVTGLYQHDIMGDMSGFFESGVRPLSVHHWKSWYHEPMPQMASVTGLCGDCFLARWRFTDDVLLVNGYSVTRYPGGLDKIDLGRMESSWGNPDHDYDFSYAPLRPPLGDQKKSYRLLDVETTSAGAFRQIYVFKADELTTFVDEVVELLWEGVDG